MSDARNLTMSTKELDRLEIIGRVVERRLTQRDAAERRGLSLRQAERLCRAFRTDGASGPYYPLTQPNRILGRIADSDEAG